MVTGCLRCTYCHSELVEELSEHTAGQTDTRSLMAKFNDQIEPIYALLRKVEDVRLSAEILEPEPTDYRPLRLICTIIHRICHRDPCCVQHLVAICMCHKHVESSETERLPLRPHACGIVYLQTSNSTDRQHLSNAVLKLFYFIGPSLIICK